MAHNRSASPGGPGSGVGGGQALVEALMRARPVVADEELIEHRFKMAAAEDEKVIEQLSACGPDPALRE